MQRLSIAMWVMYTSYVSSGAASGYPIGEPGDVYREFAVYNSGNDWRVTDPDASAKGAHDFLPNPIVELEIGELDHAVRAEAIIERWGGHPRTTAKQIRFNGGEWIDVPEIDTTPSGKRPEEYYTMDTPVVPLPLGMLREGVNTVEGTCGALDGYDWGQWGMYSVIVRVYYDGAHVEYAEGRIVAPANGEDLDEHPTVLVETDPSGDVARVDTFASYEGYDEDGDGRFGGWHAGRYQTVRGEPSPLTAHVGTAYGEPFAFHWDTTWVPDQEPRRVKLVARVQNGAGIWSVTPMVNDLTLARRNVSVRLFKPEEVDTYLGVRDGEEKTIRFRLPETVVAAATSAKLPLRTWHGWDGHHEPLRFNGNPMPIRGRDHFYDFDLLDVPVKWLRSGDNSLIIRSQTDHHMLEVLWPGPALIIRSEVVDRD